MPGAVRPASEGVLAQNPPPGFSRRRLLFGASGTAALAAGIGVLALESGALAAPPVPALPPSAPVLPRLLPAVLTGADHAEWHTFKRRFLAPDGRVLDNHNANASHSEGQGWGLLLAVAFDDLAAFDLILGWTQRTLRRPGDRLHAWRYQPGAARPVADPNPAADGDLYIAAALARAAVRWQRPKLAVAAAGIAADILRLLVRTVGDRLVLLPGVQGFEAADHVVLNPSYLAFPILPDLAAVHPSPLWARLQADGLRMIEEGRFGPYGLPPDWLRLDRATGRLSPAPGWPARFSYDAIRVPLHLAWAGLELPTFDDAFLRYWQAPHPHPPAWTDLRTGEIADYPAPPSIVAVAQFTTRARGLRLPVQPISVKTIPDYYSAALFLLSRVAAGESRMIS